MDVRNWLVIILYLLLPLGQLQKLPLGIAGVSVYVHDLVLVAIWAWILWQWIRRRRLKPATAKKDVVAAFRARALRLFLAFTALALISWLVNLPRWGNESIIGLGYLVRWILLSAPIFLQVTSGELPTTKLIKKSIFLLALLGWLQYFIFPDLTRMKYFGWDDHFFRLTGTILDPNFFGILMVMGLGLEFSVLGFRPLAFGRKLFYLVTLAFTYSRSSYLAWLVLLFGWGINKIFAEPIKGGLLKLFKIFLRSLKTYTIYFWLAVSAIIFVLVPRPEGEGGDLTRTASISGRLQNYRQTWAIIKENPIFGVGFNNLRLVNREERGLKSANTVRSSKLQFAPNTRSSKLLNQRMMGLWPKFASENTILNHAAAGADNSFLFVWATTGIFGLIVFIWLIFSLRSWWLVLPIVIHSFFNNTLFFPWVLIYLWGIQKS